MPSKQRKLTAKGTPSDAPPVSDAPTVIDSSASHGVLGRAWVAFRKRFSGLLLLALGTWLLPQEWARISTTGHGGRKSAVLPWILCMGLSFLLDPDFRRQGIFITLMCLGVVGSVVWWWNWG